MQHKLGKTAAALVAEVDDPVKQNRFVASWNLCWIINQVGNRVAALRDEQNMTQKQLAAGMGVSRSVISRIENEQGVCSLRTVCMLAAVLGVSAESLLVEDGRGPI